MQLVEAASHSSYGALQVRHRGFAMTKKRMATIMATFIGAALATNRVLVVGRAAAPEAAPKSNNEYLKGPSTKELIYVTLPGTLEGSPDANGNGIVVLDARNNYNFVKRIPTWNVPASANPEQVAGVTASPETNMIYVAARGRLGAFDLTTEKKVWEGVYDGNCCERPQMAPDSSFMYVGSDLKDFWYVINPRTGALMTKVVSKQSPNAHNLNLSQDGKLAFMSPNGRVMAIADTTTNKLVRTITFPDNVRVFVLNHDSSLIYANQNNLLGFLIADANTGKILHKVEVQGFGWPDNWNVTPRPRIPHGCPSHGIGLMDNEREVWLSDGLNNLVHVFDNTQMPPKEVSNFKTHGGAYWMTPSVDGKLAYLSSGDVVDVKTKKIIAQLKDEYGRVMHSEKLLDMVFHQGKLVQVSNQFANGFGPYQQPLETSARASR
jgi:DNA-binding beta-propeller fold protein YncE